MNQFIGTEERVIQTLARYRDRQLTADRRTT